MGGAKAATERASQLGVRRRNAQSIGIKSSDELFDAFARGIIPEKHAKAAAELRGVDVSDSGNQTAIKIIANSFNVLQDTHWPQQSKNRNYLLLVVCLVLEKAHYLRRGIKQWVIML